MDRIGLAVDGYTPLMMQEYSMLAMEVLIINFHLILKALDWYGDINIFRGSGNSWNKDIFQTDYNTGHYKYYKNRKLSLTELLAYETERRKRY